jgi:organic hydroperoxide reductase OsmC/OhrA
MSISIATIAVDVLVGFDGDPLLATAASVSVAVTPEAADADFDGLIERTRQASTVSNSIRRGVPVTVMRAA